jgi:acetoacetate decarboxylase
MGVSKKIGYSKFEIKQDMLRGEPEYTCVAVPIATMVYKHEKLIYPDCGHPISCDGNGIVKKCRKHRST